MLCKFKHLFQKLKWKKDILVNPLGHNNIIIEFGLKMKKLFTNDF